MRWLRLTATLLCAAGLAWLAIVHGLSASAMGQGDALTALAVRPHSAEALSGSAELALRREDYAAAEKLARAALIEFPRDVRALRVMGVAASMQGKARLGSELLLRSGTLSWRDEVTQVWLIRAAMDQKNYATAAQRLDAMLRSGQMQGEMLRLAHGVVEVPEARAALIERLLEAPPWRGPFFSDMESLPKGGENAHILLIEELRAREGPLPRAELTRFVRRLVEQREPKLAQRVWYGTLSAEGRTMVGVVFDGDFRLDPMVESEQPRYLFEWDLESGGGAMSSIGTPPMLIGETALNIRPGETESRVAAQTIVLDPGAHRLNYSTAGGDAATPGVAFRVLCVGHNRILPLSQVSTRTVGEWRSIEQSFEVPNGCPSQRLEILALPAGGGSNEFWLDRVSVQ
jgi:hypothetical protein